MTKTRVHSLSTVLCGLGAGALVALLVTACGGGDGGPAGPSGGGSPVPPSSQIACDDSLKNAFRPDEQTTVLLVKAYRPGDRLTLEESGSDAAPVSTAELCLVKLNVGPGHPGPEGAPSTSPGIGMEIWLPSASQWNGRMRAQGGGGFQGGDAGTPSRISSTGSAMLAAQLGVVTSFADTGHSVHDGSFAMNPDGSINTTLWRDFSSRALYEQAVKTKALIEVYYGKPPSFSYWDGGSTGGRQGLKLAQDYPDAYDGILAAYPAIYWTRFITAELYPQIVAMRDLGGVGLTPLQLTTVSNAAIQACDLVGGEHLGYLVDPSSCAYDPRKDLAVLCESDGGYGSSPACVTQVQATAFNKIWYGMTADGSVPDPEIDNGWASAVQDGILGEGVHRWYGLARGTNLLGLAGSRPFSIATDQVALQLQNPSIAQPGFMNATGQGQDQWRKLSYAELSAAYDLGLALQPQFDDINAESPDLSAFKRRGGKLLMWHGLADELVMPQGTMNYYHRVLSQMGGVDQVQSFYRLFMVPGLGHDTANGTSNAEAIIPDFQPDQMYELLRDWVENGNAPDQIVLSKTTDAKTVTRPVCAYPAKLTYVHGDPFTAGNWACS